MELYNAHSVNERRVIACQTVLSRALPGHDPSRVLQLLRTARSLSKLVSRISNMLEIRANRNNYHDFCYLNEDLTIHREKLASLLNEAVNLAANDFCLTYERQTAFLTYLHDISLKFEIPRDRITTWQRRLKIQSHVEVETGVDLGSLPPH